MPPAPTICTTLAPATVRERKMRSGISGSAAVASRTDEPREQRDRDGAAGERAACAPAVLGGRDDDRVDAEHQRGGDQHARRARRRRRATRMPASGRQQPQRGHDGRRTDRHVDEEDPVPVDPLGQRAAGQQSDRTAGGRDERVDADRLGLLARLGEHRHDQAEDDRRGERAAGALHEPGDHQHRRVGRGAAGDRSGGEHGQPG